MTEEERDLLAATKERLANGDIHGTLRVLDKLLENNPPLTAQQRLENARVHIRSKIRESLNHAAEAIVEAWKEGEYDGSHDQVNEAIESEASFSNNDDAIEYLLWSENDGAYFFHNGGPGGDKDGVDWTTLAFYARCDDLREAIENDGVDLGKRPPRDDEFWCSECDDVQYKEHRHDGKCKDCYEADGNALCTECEKWVSADDTDKDGYCKDCAPPEDEEDEAVA